MKYVSTRNNEIQINAAQAIIKGIADGGGLFVPESFPRIGSDFLQSLLSATYQERARRILSLYLTDYTEEEISRCVNNAYGSKFDTKTIAPVVSLADNQYLLELWHGPTSAFKDMALQLLPQLMSAALKKTHHQNEIVILVATSGDTGKAALEGFCDVPGIKIIVFYPEQGVSAIQRRQMVTQTGNNAEVIAIEGNFDDAQSGVKNIFSDKALNSELNDGGYELSSANSINWGRLLPQIVYYFSAYCDLVSSKALAAGSKVNFSVPTGNFGDILAGYYAKRMGLPINKLICASNSNNVLTEFFQSGIYDRNREFFKTVSPSMDILISSNLERLLYHAAGSDRQINGWMKSLNETGRYDIGRKLLAELRDLFAAGWVSEAQTLAAIKDIYAENGYVADPHTAVAWQAAQDYRKETGDTDTPMIVLSTASPYKFNDSVLSALGVNIGANDEFTLLGMLKKYNTYNIPERLAALRTAPVLHKKVCRREKMAAEIKNYLKI